MQLKTSIKRFCFIATITLVLGYIGIFFLIPYLPFNVIQPVPLIDLTQHMRAGLPVHLSIPSIHIDTPIEYVGLTPLHAMDVPKGPDNVAWFDLSPRPGEIGSAIIAGHFGWKNNRPAVFDNLSKIEIGEKIYVTNIFGVTTIFTVREIRTYGEHEDPREVFVSDDGGIHLNLITCEGIWNASTKSYSGRLVVFADEVK